MTKRLQKVSQLLFIENVKTFKQNVVPNVVLSKQLIKMTLSLTKLEMY